MHQTTTAPASSRSSSALRDRFALLALVSAMSIGLTACGGGGSSDSSANAGGATTNGPTSGDASTGGTSGDGTTSGSTSGGTTAGSGTTTATGTYGSMAAASLGVNANLNGAIPFPVDNAWNQDISQAPVHANSAGIMSNLGASRVLRPDYAMKYVVVSGTQSKVAVNFAGADESDPGPYPIPADAPIEVGDGHVLVVDKDAQRLYEISYASKNNDGSWNAAYGAVFHLDSNAVRPGAQAGWTSADAAGLPIFPGLVRYDEASKGAGGIKHALRFTLPAGKISRTYIAPATHATFSNTCSSNCVSMGSRLRLKANYVIPESYSAEAKAILQALKTYGMFVADNSGGANYHYVSTVDDSRWPDTLNSQLSAITSNDLEVVQTGTPVAW